MSVNSLECTKTFKKIIVLTFTHKNVHSFKKRMYIMMIKELLKDLDYICKCKLLKLIYLKYI